MRTLLVLILGIIIAFTISCSGDDPLDQDSEPPLAPTLRPHLGDTGDPPVTWNGNPYFVNDNTNGIDTVPEGNFIRITWEPFVDTDLSHVDVYRFHHGLAIPELIATGVSPTAMSYTDTNDLVFNTWYSYYTQLFDAAGNSSVSDTVSYAIISKCTPLDPVNGAIVSPVGIKLHWANDSTGADSFRVLMWRSDGTLLHSEDIDLDVPTDVYEFQVPNGIVFTSGETISWRIDGFLHDFDHDIPMGSESAEQYFTIE